MQSDSADSPTVSIVVPVYNVQEYLAETLDAIRAQQFTNWECLCIDDGSTDGSADIVKAYAAEDSRFHLISQANAGAATARNRGIEEANGEFLLFVDADDLPTPDMLSTCVERMSEDGSDLCAFEVLAFEPGRKHDAKPFISNAWMGDLLYLSFTPQERRVDIFSDIPAPPWNKMYRVDFLRRHHLRFPISLKRSEDTPFGASCLALAERISCVRKPLYYYRLNRPGSQMQSLSDSSVYYCYLEAADIIWNDMKERGLLKVFGAGALLLAMQNALWYHSFLHIDTRMWIASFRLKSFLKKGLEELRSAGVTPDEQLHARLVSLKNSFFRETRRKYIFHLFPRFTLAHRKRTQ